MFTCLTRWGLALVVALGLLFLVLLSGCGAAGDGGPDYNVLPDLVAPALAPEPQPVARESALTAPAAPVQIMYVDPVDELLELSLRVAERIFAQTGARIEVRDGGIPVTIRDGARQGSAQTDEWCYGGGCTAEHAWIYISSEVLATDEYSFFAKNMLTHEFVHVLSGWGKCSDEVDEKGHLPVGNIVSNGNEGYGSMSWTDADTRLACSCGACG
jgi:hypothetical protein